MELVLWVFGIGAPLGIAASLVQGEKGEDVTAGALAGEFGAGNCLF